MLANDTNTCQCPTATSQASAVARPLRSRNRTVVRSAAEVLWAVSWHTAMFLVRSARHARIAHRIQRERRALGELDAHLLDDIGVSAENAARESRRGWMDPPASR